MSTLILNLPYRKISAPTPARPTPFRPGSIPTGGVRARKEQVFATSWICVAHRSELAQPNDYITREIIGENILVVRGRDNVLRAFYNVCPHRGHQLLAGDGRAKNVITCPYHAGRSSWTANWRTRATAKTCRTSIRKTRT